MKEILNALVPVFTNQTYNNSIQIVMYTSQMLNSEQNVQVSDPSLSQDKLHRRWSFDKLGTALRPVIKEEIFLRTALCMQKFSDDQLRFCVAAADTAHIVTANFFAMHIRHVAKLWVVADYISGFFACGLILITCFKTDSFAWLLRWV
jgi:hypothetical protein